MPDDLDEFLLRAAQRRQRRGAAAPPRRRPPHVEARDAEVKDVEIVQAETAGGEGLGSDVAGQVAEYLDTSEFDARADELGDRVESAEKQMERRVEQEFGHRVGRLKHQPLSEEASIVGAVQTPAGAAGEIAALLRSPQDVRRAIILNEILSRPEYRW